MSNDATGGAQPRAPEFPNMPDEMKAYPNWVLFKFENRDGKPTKVPYSAVTGDRASVTNNGAWASFDAVQAAFERGGYDGVGFVFGANDPFAGIDLDDSEGDATIKARQDAIYDAFESYAELSPSGRGLHIIVRGSLPKGRRRDCVEVYSNERFFTMTGNVYRAAPIADHAVRLNALWHEMHGSIVQFAAKAHFQPATEADEILLAKLAAQVRIR